MDRNALRDAVEELQHAYVEAIDDDRLEEWPDFFTENCLYRVLPRENYEQNLPIALIHCDSRGMLQDRVTAHRQANLFAPHLYRHMVGSVRVSTSWDGAVVRLELAGVGPASAGSALALAAGFGGGFVSPVAGSMLASTNPLAGIGFWAACYAGSALLFSLLPETGPRAHP